MDKVTFVKSQLKLEHWRKLIAECQSSGMTVKQWCAQNYLLHNIITKNCRAKWRILHLQNGENCRGYSDHQAMKNPLQT